MQEQNFYNTTLYYRLVGLWVVCEAFAGGLMHAAKIPFTGMVVSSLAVACIMLIAYHIPSPEAILKATIIVAFFKLLLSPHSPPTAYIAVFFQGYLGYIFFNHRKHFLLSAVTVSVFALVESAMQRLLVLLVIYGNTFWEAFDIYIQKIVGGSFSSYAATAAVVYVLIHAVAGFFVGITVAKVVQKTGDDKNIKPFLLAPVEVHPSYVERHTKNKRKLRHSLIIIWILLFVFYFQAILDPANAVLQVNKIVLIVIRSVLIILTWYILISPLAMILIRRFLKRQEKRQYLPIAEIEQIIPDIQQVFLRSWRLSAANTGIARIKFFMRILFLNIIHAKPNADVVK